MKVHLHSERPLISYGPNHEVSKLRAKGFKETACGYVRQLTTSNAAKVTCKICLLNMALDDEKKFHNSTKDNAALRSFAFYLIDKAII